MVGAWEARGVKAEYTQANIIRATAVQYCLGKHGLRARVSRFRERERECRFLLYSKFPAQIEVNKVGGGKKKPVNER